MTVGIDEVGRGAWAGPLLVVAARAVRELPEGLKDSKLLSSTQREKFYEDLVLACEFGEGWVQPEEIDSFGLAQAMRLGVSRALIMLGAGFKDEIIIDGNVNYCPEEYTRSRSVIKADIKHPIVSASSIYAKVLRDRHMSNLASIYPEYGFDKHVGYGTELHRIMLRNYGLTRVHRRSFKPLKYLFV